MVGAPEAELLPVWAPDPQHKLLTWEGGTHSPGGRGRTMGWGQPCSPMGWEASAHFEFPTPPGISNTTGCCYGCCSWPQFHSAPGQLLEAKGLDWPLLLIPVPDRAFPKGSEVWPDRHKSLAQPCERCPSLAPHNQRAQEAVMGSGGLCLWQLQPSARIFLGSQGLAVQCHVTELQEKLLWLTRMGSSCCQSKWGASGKRCQPPEPHGWPRLPQPRAGAQGSRALEEVRAGAE